MERRVWMGVRVAAISVLSSMLLAASAKAQTTTLVLDAPDTEVADTAIRGGRYAGTNYDGRLLVTRESDDDPSYIRRALLKFDTETRIPRKSCIRSAILTLTVKTANTSLRTIGAYRVTQSFDERVTTWTRRKQASRWRSLGADLGKRYATVQVSGTDGATVKIDLTTLVQETVNGSYGSRYTRVALVDVGGSGTEADTYREYYSSEASSPALRPKLTVVYGDDPPPAKDDEGEDDEDDEDDQEEEEEETPKPRPGNASTLRVLHWNTHHGRGTDGDYDINRIATWIAKLNPDVVTPNEVERFVGGHGNEDQPARYAALLRQKTGVTWHYHYLNGKGGAKGGGSAILSRFALTSEGECVLSSGNNAVQASVVVNGRPVNILVTHLPPGSASSPRVAQARRLLSCADQFAESRIITGDWNATQGRTEYRDMLRGYHDAWAAAKASGKAVDYPNNSRPGATHNYRIDYVFYSKASRLRLVKAQVYNTRGNDGARASDHKPLLVTFTVS